MAKTKPSRPHPQKTAAQQPHPARPRKSDAGGLRDQLLKDFASLRIPLSGEDLDEVLKRAEQEGASQLQFLHWLIGQQAQQRRERTIERRIHDARFAEMRLLEGFDWKFNEKAIDRVQIEALASGEFVRRRDNLILVGQSGVGKSHLLQGLGHRLCALGYRVRYTTSAGLLSDLTASLADQTLPQRLRYWCRFELLILDEFGLDKIERSECPQAANLLFKLIDGRHGQTSTALATNIDFEHWGEYLGDPPLATALLDRIVDGALLMKINGRSYRASRAKRLTPHAPP